MATLLATIPNDLTLDLAAAQSVVFSTANGNAISVSSDAPDEFYAAVWVVNGTLTPAASAGVELVKTYNDSASNFYGVLLKGTADEINAALDGMSYSTFSQDTVEGNVGYPAPWSPTGDDDMLMVYLKETEPTDEEVIMDMAYMLNIDMHASADVFDPEVTLTGVVATLTSETTATLSWAGSDVGTGIDHYEYSTDGGTSWTSTTETSVTLSALANTTLTFSLRAVDGAENVSAVVSDSWVVQATGVLKATAGADVIIGGAGNDIIAPQHAVDIAGDVYDGGAGIDTLKITTSMMGIDLPATNFDFRGATLTSIEVLSFNYMPMPMPGQVIFSSDQFGEGKLSNALQVYGTWGSNDIQVHLTEGDSSFDASGWTFPVAYMGLAVGEAPTTEIVDGLATGNASSMWGHYIYQGSRDVYDGHDVGAGSEATLNGWQHGVVYAEEAGDTIRLYGSAGANAITGTMVDDQIRGDAGNDTLNGGLGNDFLDGGTGDDTAVFTGNRADYSFTATDAGIVVDGASGVDLVTGVETFTFDDGSFTAAQLASGDTTNPEVTLTGVVATLTSETSATLSWEGSDVGTGIDHYEYSIDGGTSWTSTTETSVTLSALANTTLTFSLRAVDGAENVSTLVSDSWTVQATGVLRATAGADVIIGGTGNDVIAPQRAADIAGDVYDGGAGIDTLKITTTMMGIDLPATNFDFRGATLTSIEVLSFNYMPMPMPGQVIFSSDQFGEGKLSNALQVYGTWGSNDIQVHLTEGDSNFDASGWTFPVAYMGLAAGEAPTTEILDGLATGNASSMWGHYIYQGSRDTYDGHDVGAGSEATLGGWQHGVVYAEEAGDTIRLYGSAGANAITGTMVDDQIRGDAGNDTLNGGLGNDFVAGGVNADILNGNQGSDTLRGGYGNDSLYGNKGTDQLFGGVGADLLLGGLGRDTLTGGSGPDVFLFNSTPAAMHADQITDFSVTEDTINLLSTAFVGLDLGVLDAATFAKNMSGQARAVDDRIIYEIDTGKLYFDQDGSGVATRVLFATLNDHLNITNADFLVV